MRHNNKEQYKLLIPSVLLFLLTLMVTFQVRFYGDDFFYARFTSSTFHYFLTRHIEHYKMANGRVIVHLLATIFLGLPLYLWQLINPLLLGGIVYFGSKIALGPTEKKLAAMISTSTIFISAILFLDPTITRQSIYWLTGSFNYVYPIFVLLLYWYYLSIAKLDTIKWYVPLLAFLSAATVEQVSLMTFGLTVLILFEYAIVKKKPINKMQMITLLSAAVGMLTVIACPAVFLRASIEDAPALGFLNLLKYNLKIQGTTFLFSPMMLPYHVFAMSVSLGTILKHKKTPIFQRKWVENALLILCSSSYISWFWQVTVKASTANYQILTIKQAIFFTFIMAGYFISLLYAALLFYKGISCPKSVFPAISIILCFGSQLMMVISPVYGPRNLVVAIFMLTLYTASLMPALHPINICAVSATFLCFLLNKLYFLPFTTGAILVTYQNHTILGQKIRYKKASLISGYLIIILLSFSVFLPTLQGYAKNAVIYDHNLQLAEEYKKEGISQPLEQNILPLETYGWAMPYHNPYYDPYYRLYLGVDMDTEIIWK